MPWSRLRLVLSKVSPCVILNMFLNLQPDVSAMFFFLHIPRTAGTTLNTVIRNNFAPETLISIYDREDYRTHAAHSVEELRSVRLIQGHLLLQSYDPPLFYGRPVRVFTFLREPVSRLISEYRFLRTWRANHLYDYLHRENVDFRRYVESREPQLRYRGRNFMTRCLSGHALDDRDMPRKAVAAAKRHLEKISALWAFRNGLRRA